MQNDRKGRPGRLAVTAGVICGVLALANAACGNSTGPETGSSKSCSAVVTGAVSASYPCLTAMVLDTDDGTVGMGIASNDGNPASFNFAFKVPGGALTAGTFNSSTDGASGTAVESQVPHVWDATIGNVPDQGTLSITITDIGSAVTGNSGAKAWINTHGHASATMPAVSVTGATGTVTASVSW